ncbi:hypothetical protein Y032_0015g2808 [Ancylostoma ceylanicum]|uniref:Uncharacterized protein n=1 Tax=Ancylostoma ceylanicum TaxID=53326 RepID=A0A016V7U3_9BILA|nr:hypothetical protein Y032_0015g2808 [Ancylostoma ceylanicum]
MMKNSLFIFATFRQAGSFTAKSLDRSQSITVARIACLTYKVVSRHTVVNYGIIRRYEPGFGSSVHEHKQLREGRRLS